MPGRFITAIAAALAITLMVTACGGSEPDPNATAPTTQAADMTTDTAPVSDATSLSGDASSDQGAEPAPLADIDASAEASDDSEAPAVWKSQMFASYDSAHQDGQ